LSTWLWYLTYFSIPVHVVLLLCYAEDNSGCINSDDGDMRYMLYIWGFSYLDYSFDVSISWIQNLCRTTSFVCTCIYCFTWFLRSCLSVHVLRYGFWHMPSNWIYRYTCACLCTLLGFILCTCWVNFLITLYLHVQIPELEAWSLWILHITDQSGTADVWIIGRLYGVLFFQPHCSALEFLFVTLQHLLYCLYLYIPLNSHFCVYWWCNILVILYHVLW